jgi:hypothetical protein
MELRQLEKVAAVADAAVAEATAVAAAAAQAAETEHDATRASDAALTAEAERERDAARAENIRAEAEHAAREEVLSGEFQRLHDAVEAAESAARVGPDRHILPRHHPCYRPSFLELWHRMTWRALAGRH